MENEIKAEGRVEAEKKSLELSSVEWELLVDALSSLMNDPGLDGEEGAKVEEEAKRLHEKILKALGK